MTQKARKKAAAADTSSINPDEIGRFAALAESWWDEAGPMAPLHRMNPVRLAYITAQIAAHGCNKKKTRILDIGCGAGLVSEPLAKAGFNVLGVDASPDLVAAATRHAESLPDGQRPSYRAASLEKLVEDKQRFDVVLALEILEHVKNPQAFVQLCRAVLAPGGLVLFSTLNRSPKGFLFGIVGAEYVLRWVPRGTHDWRAFIKPSELTHWAEEAGLTVSDITGLAYSPLAARFYLSPHDVGVNYFVAAKAA